MDEVEANVSTGYHAIEFLLWGQDLNGTDPGAGQRPASDFMTGADCTGGNCDRRRAYLMAATDLLIADLEDIVAAWGSDGESNPEGNALVSDVVEALKSQTRVIERVAVALGVESLELEGSDSLDDPDAVFQ